MLQSVDHGFLPTIPASTNVPPLTARGSPSAFSSSLRARSLDFDRTTNHNLRPMIARASTTHYDPAEVAAPVSYSNQFNQLSCGINRLEATFKHLAERVQIAEVRVEKLYRLAGRNLPWIDLENERQHKRRMHQPLWQNARRAIKQHSAIEDVYVDPTKVNQSIDELIFPTATFLLDYSYQSAEGKGLSRVPNENAHFGIKLPEGFLTGIVCGSGGMRLGEYVSQAFQTRFSEVLKKVNHDVNVAFKILFNEINGECIQQNIGRMNEGSAVICFLDSKANLIYTAAFGDCKANLHRKFAGKLRSIPLSCAPHTYNQSSSLSLRRDYSRCQSVDLRNEVPQKVSTVTKQGAAHSRGKTSLIMRQSFHFLSMDTRLIRGDNTIYRTFEELGILIDPIVTVNQLAPGDKLVLISHGASGCIHESGIVGVLSYASDFNVDETQALANFICSQKLILSNATVVAVTITKV